jgi:hypothetical protein
MRVQLDLASEAGIVVVRDSQVELPPASDQETLLRNLETLARAGRLFFLSTDDPVRYRIEVYVGEKPPAALDRDFEPLGGTFALEAPTGSVAVAGCSLASPTSATEKVSTVELAGGRYLLTLMGRRAFDGKRHEEDMVKMVGREDWTYVSRVDRLGLLGCLPLVLTLMCALVARWRWLLWAMVPLLGVSWLPYLVLKNTRRYKAVTRLGAEHEQTKPHFVLTLMPTGEAGLPGGFLRV